MPRRPPRRWSAVIGSRRGLRLHTYSSSRGDRGGAAHRSMADSRSCAYTSSGEWCASSHQNRFTGFDVPDKWDTKLLFILHGAFLPCLLWLFRRGTTCQKLDRGAETTLERRGNALVSAAAGGNAVISVSFATRGRDVASSSTSAMLAVDGLSAPAKGAAAGKVRGVTTDTGDQATVKTANAARDPGVPLSMPHCHT